MQHRLSPVVLCIVLTMLGSADSFAVTGPEQRVMEGVGAIIQRNQAAARHRAIQDALRKALEQAVAELLDPLILVENQSALATHLYARTLHYIRSYRVLWEYPDMSQKVYRVGIEADIATDEVAQELQTLGFARPGEERHGLLFLITEHSPARTNPSGLQGEEGVVAQELRTQFVAQGFHVVSLGPGVLWDGQEHSALLAGRKAGANVVLIGRVAVEKIRSDVAGMPLQAMQATAQVQALVTQTGERLALERAQSIAFHADALLGGKQALEKVAAELATRFIPPLRTYQQQFQEHSGIAPEAQ